MEREPIDLSGPVEERQEKVTSYLHNELEEATIDEILQGLIDGNGMNEIVCCLDMIAEKHNRQVMLFCKTKGRLYPHPDVSVSPPPPENQTPEGWPNTTVVVEGLKKGNVVRYCGCTVNEHGEMIKICQYHNGSLDPAAAGELEFDPAPIDTLMAPVDHIYKGGFFKNRHKLSWRAPIIGQALIDLFNLTGKSDVIDVGCAIGEYVEWLNEKGIGAWGIEGSEAAREFMVTERFNIMDLRLPLGDAEYLGKYNLAISLEVAEHIEPEYAGVYLNNLCLLSDTILMTAAHPGQKGHGHVNCQEKGWWASEMMNRGYGRDNKMERRWQELLKPACHRKEVNVYSKNVMIFKKYHLGG